MKPVSPAYRAILAGRQWYQADAYSFSGPRLGGAVLRYCSGDEDLTYNGEVYVCGGAVGPYFDRQDNRAKIHQKLGLEVDTLTFDIVPGAATILGAPFLTALHQGILDGAELVLDRLVMPTYGDTRAGGCRLFVGRVVEVFCGRSLVTVTVNSHLELLNLQLPRNVYQAGCLNNLGDAACGVNIASYAATGTVGGGSGAADMNLDVSTSGRPAGDFNLGKIVFTSGVLAGQSRSIRASLFNSASSASITVIAPFAQAPAEGDGFTIYSGCDKSWAGANGCPKFSNTARFRGFPYIPQPVTAL